MELVKNIRVLLAHPKDVEAEKAILKDEVERLNQFIEPNGFRLDLKTYH